MADELYYRHSGKSTVLGPPMGLIIGALAGVPLALGYAYVMLYLGYIPYIRLLCLFGPFVFGACLGLVVSGVLKWQKMRNETISKVVSALVGLSSLYASWVFATYARLDAKAGIGLLALIINPHLLWDVIKQLNQVGTWGYGTLVPTGIILWGWWALEALMILVGAIFIGGLGPGDVFCEACQEWCKNTEGVCKVKADDPAEARRRMESKDLGYLEKLGAVEPGATRWLRLDLMSCPACHATNTLTAKSVTITVDKEGKKVEGTSSLITNLLVSSNEAEKIAEIGRRFEALSAAAASGANG